MKSVKVTALLWRARQLSIILLRHSSVSIRSPTTKPTYSLDTSVVSYFLNGELWKRAPFNLLHFKPGLAYLCSIHGMERAPAYNTELKKSVTAYEWSCLHHNEVQLVASPTVGLEIARAPQVSTCSQDNLIAKDYWVMDTTVFTEIPMFIE